MIIDIDSHVREIYFMDEIYKLDGIYSKLTPKKVGDGKFQQARFLHSLDPVSPKARAGVDHNHMFDPKTQWRGGELAERQVGGYDMKARLHAIAREGIDRQILSHHHEYSSDELWRVGSGALPMYQQLDGQSGVWL